jgi:hypothetical protein
MPTLYISDDTRKGWGFIGIRQDKGKIKGTSGWRYPSLLLIQDIIVIFHELIDDSSDSMVSSARLSQPGGWLLLLLRREVSALTNSESTSSYEFPKFG